VPRGGAGKWYQGRVAEMGRSIYVRHDFAGASETDETDDEANLEWWK
jgi:hypothetical protein